MVDSYLRALPQTLKIAKIQDKIIVKRLWWFVLTNKLIHNNQFGFKKGKSVLDNLLYVDHLATRSLSLKRHLSIISFQGLRQNR